MGGGGCNSGYSSTHCVLVNEELIHQLLEDLLVLRHTQRGVGRIGCQYVLDPLLQVDTGTVERSTYSPLA